MTSSRVHCKDTVRYVRATCNLALLSRSHKVLSLNCLLQVTRTSSLSKTADVIVSMRRSVDRARGLHSTKPFARAAKFSWLKISVGKMLSVFAVLDALLLYSCCRLLQLLLSSNLWNCLWKSWKFKSSQVGQCNVRRMSSSWGGKFEYFSSVAYTRS